MPDIIKNPDYEKLVSLVQELENELAELVCERDVLLFHVCPKIKTEYMLKIGKLEYAVFEYQCKILRIKRKMELIQACINRAETYDTTEIEKLLQEKNHLLDVIQNIKQTFPYTAKDLLEDNAKLQEKIDGLAVVLSDCQEKYKSMEDRLKTMVG